MKILAAILLFYLLEIWETKALPLSDSSTETEAMPHSEDYYAGYIKALADNYDNIFASERGARSTDAMEKVSGQENKKEDKASEPEKIGPLVNANSAAPSAASESVASSPSSADQKSTNLEPSSDDSNKETTENSSVSSKQKSDDSSTDASSQASTAPSSSKEQEHTNPTLSDVQPKTASNSASDSSKEDTSAPNIAESSSKDQVQTYPGDHNTNSEQISDSQTNESDTKTEEPATPAAATEKNNTVTDIKGEAVNQTEKISNFVKPKLEEDETNESEESGSGEDPMHKHLIESFSKKSAKANDLETARDIRHYEGNQELEDMRKRNSEEIEEEGNDENDDSEESEEKKLVQSNADKRSDQTNSTSKVISGSYASYTPGNPVPQPKPSNKAPAPATQPQPQHSKSVKDHEKITSKKSSHEKIMVVGHHLPSVIRIPPAAHTSDVVRVPSAGHSVRVAATAAAQPVTAPGKESYILEHTYGEAPIYGGLLPLESYNYGQYGGYNYYSPYQAPGYVYPSSQIPYPGMGFAENVYYGNDVGKKGDVPNEEVSGDTEIEDHVQTAADIVKLGEKEEKEEKEDTKKESGSAKSSKTEKQTPGILFLPTPNGYYQFGPAQATGCGCGCGCGCNCGCGCQCGNGCTCGCNGACNSKNKNSNKEKAAEGDSKVVTCECLDDCGCMPALTGPVRLLPPYQGFPRLGGYIDYGGYNPLGGYGALGGYGGLGGYGALGGYGTLGGYGRPRGYATLGSGYSLNRPLLQYPVSRGPVRYIMNA